MNPSLQIIALRLDKWLWAARFYKTRTLAVEAVNGGHVRVNGNRSKPSLRLQVGDELTIRKDGLAFRLRVKALSERRGPAPLAQQLYEEYPDSIRQRAELIAARKQQALHNPTPARRPDKRQRRRIIRFVNKYRQDA